jgi:hypothetical protein
VQKIVAVAIEKPFRIACSNTDTKPVPVSGAAMKK